MTMEWPKGQLVRTAETLGETKGWFIVADAMARREPNRLGFIVNWVAGHGGDVLWVVHEEGGPGVPYSTEELEKVGPR